MKIKIFGTCQTDAEFTFSLPIIDEEQKQLYCPSCSKQIGVIKIKTKDATNYDVKILEMTDLYYHMWYFRLQA